jgi:hypothetical protein
MDITATEPRGRREGGFTETACWTVADAGVQIGEIWKGERGNTKCWMVAPASLGHSIPQSMVSEGYSKTTRKGAVDDLVRWHALRGARLDHDGWALHCEAEAGTERTYRALSPDGTWHAVRVAGGDGWTARGSRGWRKVLVTGAASAEAAIALLLPRIAQAPDGDETKPGLVSSLAPEAVMAA